MSNERFLNALNYCMLLPGPEAQQLAAYIGWLLHKIPGGVMSGALFVLPSMFILFGLSYTYAALGSISWVAALFDGLKAAVMAVVVAAVLKIGKKALKNKVMLMLAAASFVCIFFLKVPFPFIVLSAGLIGAVIGSMVATYFTFLPCFLFIFLGGPYIEKFRGNQKLTGALSSITAAVVGVILNLAVWFGMHVLFPAETGFDWFAAAVGLASFIAIHWMERSIITVILACAILGVARHFLFA